MNGQIGRSTWARSERAPILVRVTSVVTRVAARSHWCSLSPVSLLSSTAPPAPSPAPPSPSPTPSPPPPSPSPLAPSPTSLPLRPTSGSTAHSSANSSTPPSTSSPCRIGSMRGSSSTAQPCRRRRELFRFRHLQRRRGLGVG